MLTHDRETRAAILERMVRRRLERLVTNRYRALLVAILQGALTSIRRGARDREQTLAWVADETDRSPNSFDAILDALDEDPRFWRRVFSVLPASPRGRQPTEHERALIRDGVNVPGVSADTCDRIRTGRWYLHDPASGYRQTPWRRVEPDA